MARSWVFSFVVAVVALILVEPIASSDLLYMEDLECGTVASQSTQGRRNVAGDSGLDVIWRLSLADSLPVSDESEFVHLEFNVCPPNGSTLRTTAHLFSNVTMWMSSESSRQGNYPASDLIQVGTSNDDTGCSTVRIARNRTAGNPYVYLTGEFTSPDENVEDFVFVDVQCTGISQYELAGDLNCNMPFDGPAETNTISHGGSSASDVVYRWVVSSTTTFKVSDGGLWIYSDAELTELASYDSTTDSFDHGLIFEGEYYVVAENNFGVTSRMLHCMDSIAQPLTCGETTSTFPEQPAAPFDELPRYFSLTLPQDDVTHAVSLELLNEDGERRERYTTQDRGGVLQSFSYPPTSLVKSVNGETFYIADGVFYSSADLLNVTLTCEERQVPSSISSIECGDHFVRDLSAQSDRHSFDNVFQLDVNASAPLVFFSMSTCEQATNFDSFLRVYSDPELTQLVMENDDAGDAGQECEQNSDIAVLRGFLRGGATYYVLVEDDSFAQVDTFELRLQCEGATEGDTEQPSGTPTSTGATGSDNEQPSGARTSIEATVSDTEQPSGAVAVGVLTGSVIAAFLIASVSVATI